LSQSLTFFWCDISIGINWEISLYQLSCILSFQILRLTPILAVFQLYRGVLWSMVEIWPSCNRLITWWCLVGLIRYTETISQNLEREDTWELIQRDRGRIDIIKTCMSAKSPGLVKTLQKKVAESVNLFYGPLILMKWCSYASIFHIWVKKRVVYYFNQSEILYIIMRI
jgi:hypothetical protein